MSITSDCVLKAYNFNIKKTTNLWNEYDNTLFVDPGFNTGMAYCSPRNELIEVEVVTIKAVSPLYTLEYRYERLMSMFRQYVKDKNIFNIICEDIFMRPNSTRSMEAALSQSLFKTTNIIGMYRAVALMEGFTFSTIHAHEWRGSMNDKVVKLRLEKKLYPLIYIKKSIKLGSLEINNKSFDKSILNSHVCSALGMMLHSVKLLNEE